MRAERDQDKGIDYARPLLYGLILKSQGYAPDEAARLVIERYPYTKSKLERVILRRLAAMPDLEA